MATEEDARTDTAGGQSASRRVAAAAQVRRLARAIRDSDQATVERALLQLSQSRRLLAPVAFAVGAFVMLFEGLKLLFSNWRLTLIQVLPAMWIWAAMFDLKAHVLRGKAFHVLYGPITIPIVLGIAAITAASFFLNAVFAFAIAKPGPPEIRPAFSEARSHLAVILAWGTAIGICLGLATVIFVRWNLWWFAVSLSFVIAVMMVGYVAVPARLVGVKTTYSRRDKLTASAISGAIGALVCTPPYVLGRVGLLMLGSRALFIPGIVLFAAGLTLEAGTTSAVKAIKMSATLVSGHHSPGDEATSPFPSPPAPANGRGPSAAAVEEKDL
ncbi:MAG: hypothetical protein ACM3ML_29765 [Micromonosporaceae bacterium]